MFCNKCGAELKPDDKFCNSCGNPVSPVSDEAKYGPKPEENVNPEPNANADPYSSLDPATNPVNTEAQGNDFIAPQSGEYTTPDPNGQAGAQNVNGAGYNPQYTPNTVGPQQGSNNTNYNPQYNPNLNTNKKSHVGLIIGIILAVILIPLLIGGIIIGVIVHNVRKTINEYDYDDDNDYTYNYSYNYSSRSTSANTTPYSGYGYNSTLSRNTTTSQNVSIPNNQTYAVYDYLNDVAVEYRLPSNFTKADSESTLSKHAFLSGTNIYAQVTIAQGTNSNFDNLDAYSGFGITSEDVTIYGNTYKKITASSQYLTQAFTNTTYSDYAQNYQAEFYSLEISDTCVYQVMIMYPNNTTPPDITPFLNVRYGDIDY